MRARGGLTSYAWQKLRRQILEQSQDCALCGLPLDFQAPPRSRWSASVDHIVPLVDGGELLDPLNLRAAHFGCNSSRGADRGPTPHARRW